MEFLQLVTFVINLYIEYDNLKDILSSNFITTLKMSETLKNKIRRQMFDKFSTNVRQMFDKFLTNV